MHCVTYKFLLCLQDEANKTLEFSVQTAQFLFERAKDKSNGKKIYAELESELRNEKLNLADFCQKADSG